MDAKSGVKFDKDGVYTWDLKCILKTWEIIKARGGGFCADVCTCSTQYKHNELSVDETDSIGQLKLLHDMIHKSMGIPVQSMSYFTLTDSRAQM